VPSLANAFPINKLWASPVLLPETRRSALIDRSAPAHFPQLALFTYYLVAIRNRGEQVQAATDFCFSFDFDEWSRLAKDDPSAFEARRLALIEEFLRQFPQPDQQRLRGLQFRIDMVRRRARTPMGACLKISSMMWESLLGSHGLKTALDTLLAYPSVPATPLPHSPTTSARIIPFRKPTH
jgi:hypothetical protein